MDPFVPNDLLQFQLVKDVRLRPDGGEVAYEVRSIDAERDRYRGEIWVVPTDGRGPTRLTGGDGVESMPRWSPDGKTLAFLSDAGTEALQVHLHDRTEGRTRRLTDLEGGVSSIAWAPDGSRLLIGVLVATEADGQERAIRPQTVRRQRYKSDGVGFLLHSHSHTFVVPLEGEPQQLTNGDFDVTGAAWSPDGSQIAFCKSREGVREGHLTDVWIAAADGSSSRQLTRDVPSASTPAWAPDARSIVFSGARDSGDSMLHLWIADVATGEARPIAEELAEVASFPLVRTNPPLFLGDSVFFLRGHHGRTEIAAVGLADRTIETSVGGDQQVTVFHATGDCLAYVTVSVSEPGDVWVRSLDGANERRLTHLNAHWWKQRSLPRAELRRFDVGDGSEIEGWLLRPAGDTPLDGAPLFVDVHGGPHSFAELGFPYHVYWYALCSRGWAVLALNPVGSGSYGQAFARELLGRWGELDLAQHLRAVELLQDEKIASDRVAIGGKSYGGFLAAWAIGHTDVFSAAVVSAGVTNMESHFGTSDSGYYVGPYDTKTDPAETREVLRRLSPVIYAHRARTPTLILQGSDDQRCPVGQAEELFAILMHADEAAVEMVLYPRGHHDLAEDGRPSHRVHYHDAIVKWVERWCRAHDDEVDQPRRAEAGAEPRESDAPAHVVAR